MQDGTTVSAAMLSPRERRARMRGEMIAAILQAARSVMRERGVAGLSLREVARRVQLQASSLYEYFPGKAALYDALFLMGVRHHRAQRELANARALDTFWDYVAAWIEAYMQFAHDYPELYQLTYERPVPGFVPSEESMAESVSMLRSFEATLQRAQEEGWIRSDIPVTRLRDLLIAMMHGLTSQHMANEPDLPPGEGRYGSLIPHAVDLFRAAWGSQPETDVTWNA